MHRRTLYTAVEGSGQRQRDRSAFFRVGTISSFICMVQVSQFREAISNRYHLTYLLNTIDFDSKATRRAVESREIPIYITPLIHHEKQSRADEILEYLYGEVPFTLKDLDEGKKAEIKSTRKEEYFTLYSPNEYDPALCDIQFSLLPSVIDSLNLRKDDVFVDLGSSSGRLVMAAKLYSNCKQSVGIELSPSRSKIARDTVKKYKALMKSFFNLEHDIDGGDVSFFCGDFTDPNVVSKAGDCYFLGPGKLYRKTVVQKVLSCLCKVHRKQHKRQANIVCAGFTLPRIDGIRCTHGVTFPRNANEVIKPTRDNIYGCFQEPKLSSLQSQSLHSVKSSSVTSSAPKSVSSMSSSIRDYDFYVPMYGMDNGPRCLFYFDCDLYDIERALPSFSAM